MSTPSRWLAPLGVAAGLAAAVLLWSHAAAVHAGHSSTFRSDSGASAGVTTITLGPEVLHTGVERFGINLGGQNFYDSGQMLRNLVARNPGFEGEIWQSILRCKVTTPDTCTEENQYTQWPAGFLSGAQFEVISGAGEGQSGVVVSSSAATPPTGVTLRFAPLPHPAQPGDFLLVRMQKPGDATAGWWTDASGGATFAAERADLSPETEGHQAVRVDAAGPGQSATLSSYFDSTEGHAFVQLRGPYELSFRAKPVTGSGPMSVAITRLDTTHGRTEFLQKELHLASGWHDYHFSFQAHENDSAIGTVALQFTLHAASALLDDVSLTSAQPASSGAPAFREEVVQTLRDLHPGILRYMDSGSSFGSSLDNLLAPEFARERAGYSTQDLKQEDIPVGLENFLELCAAVGADPWISLPGGFSPDEGTHLIDFLSGPATTPYGARRAKLGRPMPWTTTFHSVHLELGNEEWNSRSFTGNTIQDPLAYGHRAGNVFAAMRHTPSFAPAHFDLIAGTWNAVPWWTGQELAAGSNADTLAIAPYFFNEFNDASSDEAIYGPMLAAPEQIDSRPTGTVSQQAAALSKPDKAAHPTRLAVYEVNLGTMSGNATQAQLDRTVPSWGGGLAVADHMLLMLRDQGITEQALFCLSGFRNYFTNTAGGARETMPLWGAVVDMGGATHRRRPTYLALQALNQVILPTMLRTTLSGANPTWDQPLSSNDKVELRGAHELQTFAFADGDRRSLIVLNLSRTRSHTVQLAAPNAPRGEVQQTVLAAAHLSDGNEVSETVRPVTATLPPGRGGKPITLPPGSLTVLRWTAAPPSPR